MSSNQFISLTGDSSNTMDQSIGNISKSSESFSSTFDLNNFLEKIFQITLNNKYVPKNELINHYVVFIGEFDENQDERLLDKDNLDEILLQRLMLTNREELNQRLRPISTSNSRQDKRSALETSQFNYLLDCYKRLNKYKLEKNVLLSSDLYTFCSNLILNISRTILNIFETSSNPNLDFSITDTMLNDHNYSINYNQKALSDPAIQLIILLRKHIIDESSDMDGENVQLFKLFYESFVNLFEETNGLVDFFKNDNSTSDDLYKLIESCELTFLNNIFIFLNKYFIKLINCEFYSNNYLKELELVEFITKKSKLMKYLFVLNSFPNVRTTGFDWQSSNLIGKFLTAHCLPLSKQQQNPQQQQQPLSHLNMLPPAFTIEYRYFTNPTSLTKRDIELNEFNIKQAQSFIRNALKNFFFDHLIKTNSNAKIRDLWLKWLGECLNDNKVKAQEWSIQNMQNSAKFCTDGFFLNILDLMLTYSMPFCGEPNYKLLLKISFDYTNESSKKKHFFGFDKETKLVPSSSSTQLVSKPTEYNFITECFYGTHDLIRLAYTSLHQKILKINNELARFQSTYQQIMSGGGQTNDPQLSRIKSMYENMTIEFLNIKASLIDDELLQKMAKFLCSNCAWLSFAALGANGEENQNFVDVTKIDVRLLRETPKNANLQLLQQIPELLITNTTEFFKFLTRFKDSSVKDLLLPRKENTFDDEFDLSNLNAFMTMILVFMGNPERLFNPHCRASLAEAIECLIPKKDNNHGGSMFENMATLHGKKIALFAFVLHPLSSFLCESLLNVFVSIEMTGQSVQFEQKFNYRRPMFELIEYMWHLPDDAQNQNENINMNLFKQHRIKMKELAQEAYLNIENSSQPLFLKFLNFLINDANYLLIEGLLYLEKIKTAQDKLAQDDIDRQSGDQNRAMNNVQRQEIEANLKHMVMLAKFHNFMSIKTLQTVKLLTSQIKNIFCHQVLVDRVATMLNDFLLHLVGKKKRKQLKVKNFEEVEFKPKEMVSNICDIYLNLGSEEKFCEAVSRDDRSYSSEFFPLAKEVLQQISRDYSVVEAFVKLGEKIETISSKQRLEDSNFDDAPDEFLDPIMSHLMSDPVILPNSKKIIDRQTIARHLLSDQSDPFNRSPLKLQDVIPATELKNEIEKWKLSKMGQK